MKSKRTFALVLTYLALTLFLVPSTAFSQDCDDSKGGC
jgi:hypothetical protein